MVLTARSVLIARPRPRSRTPRLLGMLLMAPTIPSTAFAGITKAPLPTEKSAYTVEIIAKKLEHPWALQFLPDGRMLVTERPGRLRIVARDGRISKPVQGVPPVVARDQGGLMDVALAADFDQSGTLYLTFSEPRERGQNGTAVYRARLVLTAEGEGRLEEGRVIRG